MRIIAFILLLSCSLVALGQPTNAFDQLARQLDSGEQDGNSQPERQTDRQLAAEKNEIMQGGPRVRYIRVPLGREDQHGQGDGEEGSDPHRHIG